MHTRNDLTHPNGPAGGSSSSFYSGQNVLYQLPERRDEDGRSDVSSGLELHESNDTFVINNRRFIGAILSIYSLPLCSVTFSKHWQFFSDYFSSQRTN